MSFDTRPPDLDALGQPNDLDDWRVREGVEIRHLLKSVMDRNVAVTLNASDGTVFATTLWSVDAQQGKIGITAALLSPSVHRLVEAEEAVAVC